MAEEPVCIKVPLDLFQRMVACLEECAEDLQAEIDERSVGADIYPTVQRRRERDLAPVRHAQVLLTSAKAIPGLYLLTDSTNAAS